MGLEDRCGWSGRLVVEEELSDHCAVTRVTQVRCPEGLCHVRRGDHFPVVGAGRRSATWSSATLKPRPGYKAIWIAVPPLLRGAHPGAHHVVAVASHFGGLPANKQFKNGALEMAEQEGPPVTNPGGHPATREQKSPCTGVEPASQRRPPL